jgi:hypothetical protein
VDLDLVKKRLEAKTLKLAGPSKSESVAGGEDVRGKIDRLLEQIKFLEEYKKSLELEIENMARIGGRPVNALSLESVAQDLEIEVAKRRVQELYAEISKLQEEAFQ